MIQKIRSWIKSFGGGVLAFAVTFAATLGIMLAKFIYFIVKLFAYPIVICVWVLSLAVVCFSFWPSVNFAKFTNVAVRTFNIFSHNDIVLTEPRASKQDGFAVFSFQSIQYKNITIPNLQIKLELLPLATFKAINIFVESKTIQITPEPQANFSIKEGLMQLPSIINFLLATHLPIKQNIVFKGQIDIDGFLSAINFNLQKKYNDTHNNFALELNILQGQKLVIDNNKNVAILCRESNQKNNQKNACTIELSIKNININNVFEGQNIVSNIVFDTNYSTPPQISLSADKISFAKTKFYESFVIAKIQVTTSNFNLHINAVVDDLVELKTHIKFENLINYTSSNVYTSLLKKILKITQITHNTQDENCDVLVGVKIIPQNVNSTEAISKMQLVKLFDKITLPQVAAFAWLKDSLVDVNVTNAVFNIDIGKKCLANYGFQLTSANTQWKSEVLDGIIIAKSSAVLLNITPQQLVIVPSDGTEVFFVNKQLDNPINASITPAIKTQNTRLSLNFNEGILDIQSSTKSSIKGNLAGLVNLGFVFANKAMLQLLYNNIADATFNMQLPIYKNNNKNSDVFKDLTLFANVNFNVISTPFISSVLPLSLAVKKDAKSENISIIAKSEGQTITPLFTFSKFNALATIQSPSPDITQINVYAVNGLTNTIQSTIQNGIANITKIIAKNKSIANLHTQETSEQNYICDDDSCQFAKAIFLLGVGQNNQNTLKNMRVQINTQSNNFTTIFDAEKQALTINGKFISFEDIIKNMQHYKSTAQSAQGGAYLTKLLNAKLPTISVDISQIISGGASGSNILFNLQPFAEGEGGAVNIANVKSFTLQMKDILNFSFNQNNLLSGKIQNVANLLGVLGVKKVGKDLLVTNGEVEVDSFIKNDNFVINNKVNNLQVVEEGGKNANTFNGGYETILKLVNAWQIQGALQVQGVEAKTISQTDNMQITNFKLFNAYHTLFGQAEINLQNLTIVAKISYAPSFSYNVQNAPLLNLAFKAISLNREEGAGSITYTIKGPLFSPEVKFGSISFLLFKIGHLG